MMNTFTLNVLAAEKPFFEGDCISLVIPTNDGQYGILAKHNNMIAAIVPGVLKITTPDGTETVAAVSEGLVKVENNQVLILVDTVERPEEIDENRARRSAEQAKKWRNISVGISPTRSRLKSASHTSHARPPKSSAT